MIPKPNTKKNGMEIPKRRMLIIPANHLFLDRKYPGGKMSTNKYAPNDGLFAFDMI
jgi:hypothetical protein